MFKFGFGEEQKETEAPQQVGPTIPPQKHGMELLAGYPRISWTSFELNNEQVPRRDIFDVRYSLMAQDSLSQQEALLLGNEDVRKNVYEGGLKVWEGSIDLVTELKDNSSSDVLELGCGAAVPSCYLLYKALKSKSPARFVLCDYNEAVLRLLTLPNCILAWLASCGRLEGATGEINLTAELLNEFKAALEEAHITIEFVSGGWSPKFSELTGEFQLVLASETIYSLESLDAFIDVLQHAIGSNGQALVAAKKVYFGVGGSVVEFLKRIDARKLQHSQVGVYGDVGRVVLRVSKQ